MTRRRPPPPAAPHPGTTAGYHAHIHYAAPQRHTPAARLLVGICASWVVICLWAYLIAPHTPPNTVPLQLLAIAAAAAVSAVVAHRYSQQARRRRSGQRLDGWAQARAGQTMTDATIELLITIPGAPEQYAIPADHQHLAHRPITIGETFAITMYGLPPKTIIVGERLTQ